MVRGLEERETDIDVAVLVEPGETLEGSLDVLCRDVTDFLGLEDADEPPVAVGVVHEEEGIALDDVCLALYGGGEGVEGVDEVKVDGLVGDGEGGRAVVVGM